MYQSYTATTSPEQGPGRLAQLRAAMAERGIDAFLVPRADAHQGEYVAPCDERLAWLTGFTGSAGFAAVLADRAGVFVDSRYRLQVRDQVAIELLAHDRVEPERRVVENHQFGAMRQGEYESEAPVLAFGQMLDFRLQRYFEIFGVSVGKVVIPSWIERR